MKQRQQQVHRPMPHENTPIYLSVVHLPPGAPPGGGMALWLLSTTRRPRAGETVKGEVVQPAAVAGTVVTQPGSGVPPGCAPGGHCRRLCGNHRSPRHRRDTVDPQGRRTSTAASSPGSSASSAAGASSAARAIRGKSTTRPTARRSWPAARRRGSSSRCAKRRPLSSKVDKLTSQRPSSP